MSATVVATAFGGPEVLRVIDEQVPKPGPGKVVVEFAAIGVNPFEYKQYSGAFGTEPAKLPMRLGSEGAGVIVATGDGAAGPAGPLSVGDEVVVFRGAGTYAARSVQAAFAVLPKPAALDFAHAAGLLLTGTTAYDLVVTTAVTAGDVVLVHGAAGAVGQSAIQLARLRGATVIGTAREANHEYLRGLGAIPVTYGPGLADRVRAAAPGPVTAAIDTVGTDEAVDVSLELVADRTRIASIAAFARAQRDGFAILGGGDPAGTARRMGARAELLALAATGKLVNVVAKSFPLADVARAHAELAREHPLGKFVLIP